MTQNQGTGIDRIPSAGNAAGNADRSMLLDVGRQGAGIILNKEVPKLPCFVVYLGNILHNQERRYAGYFLGGKLHGSPCVPLGGYLARCRITQLVEAPIATRYEQVPEERRGEYVRTFQMEMFDAEHNKIKLVTIGGPPEREDENKPSSALLFKMVSPMREIGRVAGQADGCVQVPHLQTAADAREAQFFLFDNWNRIVERFDTLPLKVAALQDHLQDRYAVANSDVARDIVRVLLDGSRDYYQWAVDYVARQTRAIETAKQMKGTVVEVYDDIAENLMVECNIQREDNLIRQFALGNLPGQQPAALPVVSVEEMELRKREVATKELELHLRLYEANMITPEKLKEVLDRNAATLGTLPMPPPASPPVAGVGTSRLEALGNPPPEEKEDPETSTLVEDLTAGEKPDTLEVPNFTQIPNEFPQVKILNLYGIRSMEQLIALLDGAGTQGLIELGVPDEAVQQILQAANRISPEARAKLLTIDPALLEEETAGANDDAGKDAGIPPKGTGNPPAATGKQKQQTGNKAK